jgi:hypothetical protein
MKTKLMLAVAVLLAGCSVASAQPGRRFPRPLPPSQIPPRGLLLSGNRGEEASASGLEI